MAVQTRKKSPPISRRETTVSLAILALLVVVAVGVYAKQFSYDPVLFEGREAGDAVRAGAGGDADATVDGTALATFAGELAETMGPPEVFDRETLSDKINGKAELYLESGFVRLVSQRFAEKGAPDRWFEMYVYDMGEPMNAFAVFSNQRRSDAQDTDVTRFSYATGGSHFLVQGRHYAELIASDATESLADAVTASARELAAGLKTEEADKESTDASEVALLPADGLVPGSVNLMLNDAFGYDRFNNVLAADFVVQDTTTTAFLSIRKDAAEAADLARGYHEFLTVGMGAANMDVSLDGIDGLRGADVLGDTELVFHVGRVVAGVHVARSRAAAEQLARMLHDSISRREP